MRYLNKNLTAHKKSAYTVIVDLLGGLLPALLGAVLFLGYAPGMSRFRKGGSGPQDRRQSRAFLSGKVENLGRCSMKKYAKGKDTASGVSCHCDRKPMPLEKVSVKEILMSHLRDIQLQTRLLLLASTFDGFQLQAADVQSLCSFLLDYIGRVQKTLKEAKP